MNYSKRSRHLKFSFNEILIIKLETSYQFGALCNFVLPIHVTITKCSVIQKEDGNHHFETY